MGDDFFSDHDDVVVVIDDKHCDAIKIGLDPKENFRFLLSHSQLCLEKL